MNSTLLLNADGTPVSMMPLSTISWKEAVSYLISGKAIALEWYNDWLVRSQRWSTRVPAVMILTKYQKRKVTVRFSKQHVFLRDNYTCQYCEKKVDSKSITIDHILPLSLGGRTTWENTTTACSPCNSLKGNNKKIVPLRAPYKPNIYDLIDKRKKLGWNKFSHPSWQQYLNL